MINKQKDSKSLVQSVAYAAAALQRQEGIVVQAKSPVACMPVEFITHETFAVFTPYAPELLITGARARSLGLLTDSDAVLLSLAGLSLPQIHALADPTKEGVPLIQEFTEKPDLAVFLTFAKYAGVLPALLVMATDFVDWAHISDSVLIQDLTSPHISVIETARAKLPLVGAEDATIASFRTVGSDAVHLALIVGDVEGEASPLIRVHSSCVTGDLLGSLRCDCGNQLALALETIKKAGKGILLYLNQEGRGIGITNKLRAYQLQERGIDTYDANLMLGFDEDERDFSSAAAILKSLGVLRIQLLSNNPNKVSALEKHGITVAARVPLIVPTSKHNHAYIHAKSVKAGHIF